MLRFVSSGLGKRGRGTQNEHPVSALNVFPSLSLFF